MMQKIFLFLFFISSYNHAQNLVDNPSYESYSNCPTNDGIFVPLNWTNVNFHQGSPDYLNTCASQIFFSIPSNIMGYQEPYNGEGYIGLFLYQPDFGEVREYVQTQLNQPLIAGNSYIISMFVSLSDESNLAINNIGALLSNDDFTANIGTSHIPLTPQLNSEEIISNKIDWVEINGTYIANGGEQYLTIGNFFDDNNTTILDLGGSGFNSAYYYIDMISVTNSTLSESEFSNNSEIKIYPNPFSSKLNLKFENIDNIKSIEIFSTLGNAINIEEISNEINLEQLHNGIYFIKITTFDSKELMKKIIKY